MCLDYILNGHCSTGTDLSIYLKMLSNLKIVQAVTTQLNCQNEHTTDTDKKMLDSQMIKPSD